MAQKDYYQILGVTRSATSQEIKSAYKKLAKKYHPDINQNLDSHEKFKEISRAYQVLSDPEKKTTYDRLGHTNFEEARKTGYTGQSGFNQQYNVNYEDIFGRTGFRDPFDIFNEFFGQSGFGQRSRQSTQSQRGEDLELVLSLDFQNAVTGTEKEIAYDRFTKCSKCQGSGSANPDQEPVTCPQCGGNGQVRTQQSFLGASFTQITTCPNCQGVGQVISNPCKICKGSGREKVREQTKIKIPAGIDTNTTIRYPGKGNAGKRNHNAGDLYVTFKVKPHAVFTRNKENIYLDLEISPAQAVLGATIEIPTLKGKERLKIPAGTQPDDKLKLSQAGIPIINTARRGDQIINIKIKVPKKISQEEKELYKKIHEVETKPQSILDKLFT